LAVVAALVGLAGAGIRGCASYKAAQLTATSTRQQEFDQFKREEQKEAYANYLKELL
jgi:hypothetical protein